MTLSGKKAFSSVTLLLAEGKKRTLWTVHIFPEKRGERPSSTIYFIDALVLYSPGLPSFFPSGRILVPEQDEKRHWGSKKVRFLFPFPLGRIQAHTHKGRETEGWGSLPRMHARDFCAHVIAASALTGAHAFMYYDTYMALHRWHWQPGFFLPVLLLLLPSYDRPATTALALPPPPFVRPSPPSPSRPLPYVASGDRGRRNDLISFPSFCLFPIEISQDSVTLQGRLRQGSREG